MHHEKTAGVVGSARHRAGDLHLAAAIVFGLAAVTAEVTREENGIGLARLRDEPDDALEVEDVFLTGARDVDWIARGCGRRQHAAEWRRQPVAERLDLESARDQ